MKKKPIEVITVAIGLYMTTMRKYSKGNSEGEIKHVVNKILEQAIRSHDLAEKNGSQKLQTQGAL